MRSTARRSVRSLACLAVVFTGLAVAGPARAETLVGVTTTNQLATFDSDAPQMVRSLVSIAGLQPDETLCGIDFRPSNGQLYGIGSTSRVYMLDPATGRATQVGQPGSFSVAGSFFGIDFDPVSGLLELVSDVDQNLAINADTGALAALRPSLAYGAGDLNQGRNPFVTGLSHTNSVAGARTSAAYAIDSFGPDLTRLDASRGALSTVGPLEMEVGVKVGSDISGLTGVSYLSVGEDSSTTIATRDLATGRATPRGAVPLDLYDVSAETPRGYDLGGAKTSAFLPRRGTITTRGVTVRASCPVPDPFPEGADFVPEDIKCVVRFFLSIENPGSSGAVGSRAVRVARGSARVSGGKPRRARLRLTRRGRSAVGRLRKRRVRGTLRASVRYRQPGRAELRRTLRRTVSLQVRRRR